MIIRFSHEIVKDKIKSAIAYFFILLLIRGFPFVDDNKSRVKLTFAYTACILNKLYTECFSILIIR